MTNIPTSYAAQDEKSSPLFAGAFAAGCKGPTCVTTDLQPGPVALFGTPSRWPVLDKAIAEGRDWYYGDHGYFSRFRHYRITKNAYQHDGRGAYPSDRLRALHVDLKPWNTNGTSIVVCPNSPVYMARFGIDAEKWVADIVARLMRMTKRPVIARWKSQAAARPLYVDLHDAHMVVAFSSASAVEGLAAGVPCCTLAPWASTARMGITNLDDVETPIYPEDRDQFLFNLTYQQWTLDEIRSGMAWKALRG